MPVGRKGAGQVTTTAFSVPAGSLGRWKAHLEARGVAVQEGFVRFGEPALVCADPSGLRFELIGTDRDSRAAWSCAPLGPAAAIRGLHSVTLTVRSAARTLDLLTGLLGWRVVDEAASYTRLAHGHGRPGQIIDVTADAGTAPAMNGLGTVHHVAMAIVNGPEQARLRDDLIQYGCQVTEIRDRCYFTSIYFREPGGVLLEVATVDPGFAVDEEVRDLGTGLKLPPWEEVHRPQIERALPPINTRQAV